MGVPHLVFAEGDAEDVSAIFLGGIDRQATPAAADVQQTLAGLQPEFAADVFQFVLLRSL